MNVLALLKDQQQDERLIRRLTMKGYRLFLPEDTGQALDLLQKQAVHAVVVDTGQADRSFLARLRQMGGPDYIYVFALTAGKALSPQEQAYLGYVDEYLARPFEPDELVARLVIMERYLNTLVNLRAEAKTRQPIRDPVTGVFSRSAILELLEAELERSRRTGKPFTLAMFSLENIDAFRREGDGELLEKALAQFALKVWASVRAYDLIGCWGENKFVLILPETVRSDAAVVMERIQRNVQSVPVQMGDGRVLDLQISRAMVQSNPFGEDDSQLLLAAVESSLRLA